MIRCNYKIYYIYKEVFKLFEVVKYKRCILTILAKEKIYDIQDVCTDIEVDIAIKWHILKEIIEGNFSNLFVDSETKGKKEGACEASKEYEKVFRNIAREFLEVKNILEQEKDINNKKIGMLIEKLEHLEIEKEILERKIKEKSNELSIKYKSSLYYIRNAISYNTLISENSCIIKSIEQEESILEKEIKESLSEMSIKSGMSYNCFNKLITNYSYKNQFRNLFENIFKYKEKKFKRGKQEGYIEAKEIYEKKIQALKTELSNLKMDGYKNIDELILIINEILNEISDKQMRIAELKILLGER